MAESSEIIPEKKVFKRKPRVPSIQKSLAIFLVSLQGERVVFELKDDSEVSGVLEESDRSMNSTLVDAAHVYPDGRMIELETAHVLGTSIRYVHFQSHVNPKSVLSNYLKKIERIGKRSQPHTIKDRPKRSLELETTEKDDQNDSEKNTSRLPAGEIYLGYDDVDALKDDSFEKHNNTDKI